MSDSNTHTPKTTLRNVLLMSFLILFLFGGMIIILLTYSSLISYLKELNLSYELIREIYRYLTISSVGGTIVGILLILWLSFLLSHIITNPVNRLISGMKEISSGKWSTRINIEKGIEEIDQLSYGFNKMAEHTESVLEELQNAKQNIEDIINSVPSILIVINSKRKILSCNRVFDKLKKQYPSLRPEDLIQRLDNDIKSVIETGEEMTNEITINIDSTSLVFSSNVSLLRESYERNQQDLRLLITLTDITERNKMKELVLQSKQDWENTFDIIPDMITIHDRDYNIILANKAARENLNLPLMIGPGKINKCFKYYHGTDSAPEGCPSCECYLNGRPVTFELFEPHLNKYIEIRAIPRVNSNNEIIGLIHIVRDITARKKVEEERNKLINAITKAKREWEQIFDSTVEMIMIIDKEMNIIRCNKSVAEYAKKDADTLKGYKCYEIFSCSEADIESCREAMKAGMKMDSKREVKTSDGRWLYLSHQPLMEEERPTGQIIVVGTDITDLKRTQMRLAESEKELKKRITELERFYDMAIGREIKMKELKKENRQLKEEIKRLRNGQLVAG